MLTESEVQRSFRNLFKSKDVAPDTFEKAEALLDELRAESPLRHRLSIELEEIRKLHTAKETGQDGAYAARTRNASYRTTPLRGLWQHPPYFHDGSAKTLNDVVDHYDKQLTLRLTTKEKADLVEYLKTL